MKSEIYLSIRGALPVCYPAFDARDARDMITALQRQHPGEVTVQSIRKFRPANWSIGERRIIMHMFTERRRRREEG